MRGVDGFQHSRPSERRSSVSSHPLSSHVEKLISKLQVFGQPSKPHALARVVHAFLVAGHDEQPSSGLDGARYASRRMPFLVRSPNPQLPDDP